jgi:hypothetical protein
MTPTLLGWRVMGRLPDRVLQLLEALENRAPLLIRVSVALAGIVPKGY